MGVIYLVRHAQASFGTDDYDRLTPIGFTQARLLGEYFARRRIRFDAVYSGTLRRHAETTQAIAAGEPDRSAPAAQCFPGLNEYKPEALLAAFTGVLPEPGAAAVRRDAAVVREHFRLLRDALMAWALDRPSWPPRSKRRRRAPSNSICGFATAPSPSSPCPQGAISW